MAETKRKCQSATVPGCKSCKHGDIDRFPLDCELCMAGCGLELHPDGTWSCSVALCKWCNWESKAPEGE